MPSSKSLAHSVNRLPRLSRTTAGVAAASAAVAGIVAGAALSSTPAAGATSLASSTHAAALSTAGQGDAHTLSVSSFPLGDGATSPAHQAARTTARVVHTQAPRPQNADKVTHRAATDHDGRHANAGRTAHAAAPRHMAVHPRAVSLKAAQTKPVSLKAAARHAAPARPAQPYEFYDSVTPSAIPGGHEIATYADGPFAVPASQVAGRQVLWIDTNGSDPSANALDVEPGDATPSIAASWTSQKLSADPHATAIIYTMQSEWPATQSAVAALPTWMHSHVRWWIADPTGYPHLVPGSNATQWDWGSSYDISTATPGF
jgi:hypothetical protein